MAWLDTACPRPLPLVYTGNYTDAPPDGGETCEAWIGPRGERVFYFHANDEDYFLGFARGDPMRRRSDPGRVYFSFSRANLFWIETAMLSVRKAFPKAELRLLTSTNCPKINTACAPETERSSRDRAYIAPLLSHQTANVRLSLSADHGTRFQAKIALGFGHALFGPAFAALPYSAQLRSYLWEKDGARRAEIGMHSAPLLAGDTCVDRDLLAVAGATTFTFCRERGSVKSIIYGPSGRPLRTVIAADAGELSSPVFDAHGRAFIVILIPGRSKCIGPYPLTRWIMHRTGGLPIVELAAIAASFRSVEENERALAQYDVLQPKLQS